MVAIPELPEKRFVKAVLESEELLRQQADSVFARCDLNKNGQIERDELQVLCEALHQRIGLKIMDQIELGRRLGRFDVDFSGGLDSEEFVKLYKNLLQDAVGDNVLPQKTHSRSRSRGRVSPALADVPSDPRYIRAILSSEHLLRQQAYSTFTHLDLDSNGQVDRDELYALCLALHEKLGLKLPDDVALGVHLARYDEDLSGGLDRSEFMNLYRQLLQESLERVPGGRSKLCKLQLGEEIWAPYLGEESKRRYRALVTSVMEVEGQVCLRWLRPPLGQRPKEYVSGHGLDDTQCTKVPLELVRQMEAVSL